MATGQEWGQALQGMGAWFAGQGPQYETAQAVKQRTEQEDAVLRDERRRKAMIQDFTTTYAFGKNGQWDAATELLQNRVGEISMLGGNPKDTIALYEAIADPARRPEAMAELESFMQAGVLSGDIKAPPTAGEQYSGIFTTADNRRAGLNNATGMIEYLPSQQGITARAPEAAQQPASLQEMAWLNNPARTQAELDMYWRNKRAEQIVALGGGGQGAVTPSGDTRVVVAPEDAAAREAAEAAAVKGAEATATADVERKNAQRGNAVAYDAYQQAMNSIRSSFGKTDTGPISGRLPAVTVGQQTAEGSVSAAAPVLKQLFRSAGEGVFTDKDQQLLLDMMPKRTDHPEVVASKLEMVDAVVAAKLNMGKAPLGSSAPQTKTINGKTYVQRNGQWYEQ